MINLAAQELFHAIDDATATNERPVDIVVDVVFDRELDDSTLAIPSAGCVLSQAVIGTGEAAQQVDLFLVEKVFDQQITILVVASQGIM